MLFQQIAALLLTKLEWNEMLGDLVLQWLAITARRLLGPFCVHVHLRGFPLRSVPGSKHIDVTLISKPQSSTDNHDPEVTMKIGWMNFDVMQLMAPHVNMLTSQTYFFFILFF